MSDRRNVGRWDGSIKKGLTKSNKACIFPHFAFYSGIFIGMYVLRVVVLSDKMIAPLTESYEVGDKIVLKASTKGA